MVYSDAAAFTEELLRNGLTSASSGGLGLDLNLDARNEEKVTLESFEKDETKKTEEAAEVASEISFSDETQSSVEIPSTEDLGQESLDDDDNKLQDSISDEDFEPIPISPTDETSPSTQSDVPGSQEFVVLASSNELCGHPVAISDLTPDDELAGAKPIADPSTLPISFGKAIGETAQDIESEELSTDESPKDIELETEGDVEGEGVEGPGGFVLLSSSEDACVVDEDISNHEDVQVTHEPISTGKQDGFMPVTTQEEPEQKLAEVHKIDFAFEPDSISKKSVDIEDKVPVSLNSGLSMENTAPAVVLASADTPSEEKVEEKTTAPAIAADDGEAESPIDPNKTLEEDLQDVEKALKE